MVPIGFNLNFINNKEAYLDADKKPYALALAGLMVLTGIRRLFVKEDVYELIKRAQMLLKEQKMIDRFFIEDVLFSFQFEKQTYEFTVLHLKALIGLETLNGDENHIPYTRWASNLDHYILICEVMIHGEVFKGLKLMEFDSGVSISEDVLSIDLNNKIKNHIIENTEEQLSQAEFLGKSIVKELPENLFVRIKEEFPNKIKELELRRMPFEEPIFNFEAYPIETQRTIWKQFWPEMEYFDDPDQRAHDINLFYLAWLWANGFVSHDNEGFYFVDSRIKNFNLEDYELEDGGTNLLLTYEREYLEELAPFLYDPEVAKLAERPWESLDIYEKVTKPSKYGIVR